MKQILFFLLLVVAGISSNAQNLSRLYAYSNKDNGGYFYTVNYSVLEKGEKPFKLEKFGGVVHTADDRGTSPVYMYINLWGRNHFYTINEDEIGNGEYGYNLMGVAFYAYKKKVPGTIALHRYFHQQKRTHFYSTQKAKEINGYGYEGIAFYIFPDEKTAKASVKKKDAVTFLPPLVTRPFTDDEVPPQLEMLEETRIGIVNQEGIKDEKMEIPMISGSDVEKYIHINFKSVGDFTATWKNNKGQRSVVVSSGNRDIFTFVLPVPLTDDPVAGFYRISGESVKNGTRDIKLVMNNGSTVGEGGNLIIEHNKGEVWLISADYSIVVTDPKTKEKQTIGFIISVPATSSPK